MAGSQKCIRFGVVAGCLALLTATSAHAQNAAYNIGMTMDLTGPISFNGQIAAAGFETAIAKLNAAGGVNGRTIKLTVSDDASDLAKGKANVQRFADDGSLAVFGFILSSVSAAAAPLAAKDKMPLFALGALTELVEPAQPYYFSYELQAAKLSDRILAFIEKRAKEDGIAKPRIAVLAVDVPSGRQVADRAAKDIARRGWVLADTQFFPVAPTDITSQASAIKAAAPDYVLLNHNDGGALVAVRGLRSAGITVPVINQWAGSADATFQRLGKGYIAFRTFVGPAEVDIPAVKVMREAAEKAGRTAQMTSPYFTQGYVAGTILQKALEKCGKDCKSGEELAKAAETIVIDSDGLSGPMAVSKENHEFVKTVRFYTWDESANAAKPITGWIGPEAN